MYLMIKNWEILTIQLLLILKVGMWLRMKKKLIQGFTEKSVFQDGGSQKTNIQGVLPKKVGGGGVKQFADLRDAC